MVKFHIIINTENGSKLTHDHILQAFQFIAEELPELQVGDHMDEQQELEGLDGQAQIIVLRCA